MLLDRATIIDALKLLNDRLAVVGARAELCLVGGAVMCLVHQARTATKDVDRWFTEPSAVRAAARSVAEELWLPADWLNDAAKAYVPQNAWLETWQEMSNLYVSVVDVPTLLAMKCAAARSSEDASDIRFLADRLGLRSSSEVLAAIGKYIPETRLPVRTRLLLEEMLDDRL